MTGMVRRALEDGLPATESCEGAGGRRGGGRKGKREGDRRVQLVVYSSLHSTRASKHALQDCMEGLATMVTMATKPLAPLTSASSLTTCQFTQHTPDTMAEDSQSGHLHILCR